LTGFVFRLIPPRPDFAATMSDDERAFMTAHVKYWSDLIAQGRCVAVGPVADPAGGYGLGVVLAEDFAAAEDIRDKDPALAPGSGFRTEIAPMYRLATPTGSFNASSEVVQRGAGTTSSSGAVT
jgi:uncharacterized protein YciI